MSDIRAYEQPGEAGFGDYVQLLKPRVMSLVVFTALVGLLVAPAAIKAARVRVARRDGEGRVTISGDYLTIWSNKLHLTI